MLKCKVKKTFLNWNFFSNTFFELEKYLEFSLSPKFFTDGDFPSPVKTIAITQEYALKDVQKPVCLHFPG